MRSLCLITVLLAGDSLLFGQLDSDTLTIQASRSVNLTPDQVVFSISVSASPNTSLDQVVATLANLGVTAANLANVASGTDSQSAIYWDFTLAAPLAKIKATIASLTALQRSIVQNSKTMTLMFQVQGSQVSPDLIQSQACPMTGLFAEAQAQAQSVASVAGLAIGPVITLSNLSLAPVPSQVTGGFAVADFTGSAGTIAQRVLTTPRSAPVTCSLVVKFKLLRYQ